MVKKFTRKSRKFSKRKFKRVKRISFKKRVDRVLAKEVEVKFVNSAAYTSTAIDDT